MLKGKDKDHGPLQEDWDAIKSLINSNQEGMPSCSSKCDMHMPSNTDSSVKLPSWHGITDDPDELELLAYFQRKLMELRTLRGVGQLAMRYDDLPGGRQARRDKQSDKARKALLEEAK
eukprot:4874732-Pyramimonas_sp.AAC.1